MSSSAGDDSSSGSNSSHLPKPPHSTSSDENDDAATSSGLDTITRLLMRSTEPQPAADEDEGQLLHAQSPPSVAGTSSPTSMRSPHSSHCSVPLPLDSGASAETQRQTSNKAGADVDELSVDATTEPATVQAASEQHAQPSPQPRASVGVAPTAVVIDLDGRYCWVCFATDEDDALAEWVQPCNCIGTIRWVHQGCLQRWVEEKQKGNSMRRVTCPQCQTEYIIVYPAMSLPVLVMERFDTMIKCLSPFLAAGILVGSLYWSAVTFGAVTVLQVVGQQDGLEMMEHADPLVMLIGLPAIPVGLVLGRMVRWEDMVLRVMQNRRGMVRKFPLLSWLLPTLPAATSTNGQAAPAPVPPAPVVAEQVSGTRIFCGALLLPTFSAIMGRVFFDSIQNNVHRTLIGGLAFVALKGAVKIYFKQKQMQRKQQRKILDYTAENRKKFGPTATGQQQRGGQQREVVI